MAKHPVALDFLAYSLMRGAIAIVQALPLSLCDRAAGVAAWLFAKRLKPRGALVDRNLQIAFPESSPEERLRLCEGMWRHLFLMIAEIAHTPRKVHRTTWRDYCLVRHDQLITQTMIREEPTVLISGHYGNFELGGYLLGLFGFPTHTVARTIDNRFVDRYVNRFRGRTGQFILPKQGSGEDVQRVMEAGGALTLLGDQSAGRRGCWVDFFGKPASTHKAVSLFTLGHQAPTLVIGVRRRGKPLHYEVVVQESLDPNDRGFAHGSTPLLTQWFTDALERIIRRAPEQYWWVHNRWKGEPPARRKESPAVEQVGAGA